MKKRAQKQFDWLLESPIAHRGLHDDKTEENSLEAFKAAADKGYGIELDVHLLKDGKLAVFHDFNLRRICGVGKKIEKLTSEELKNYPMKKDGQKIPLLEEVFEAVDGRVPVLIEIKSLSFFNRRLEKILLETVEKYKGKNIVAIQSFNVFSVKYLIKHGAQYPIGQLYSTPNFIIITFKNDKLVFKGFNPPDFIAYDVRKLPEKLLHKDKPAQDFPILIWTVNSNNARIKATNFGNNIIFENIDPEEKNDKQSR